jgi:hypothetical protein
MIDFLGMAESVAQDFYILGFGVKPDYTPASIVELDVFVDELEGTDGKIRRDGDANLSKGQTAMALKLGSYLGETIRRCFGGQWVYDPTENIANAAVKLAPNAFHVVPIHMAAKRLREGSRFPLHSLYQLARQECGVPKIDEVASYRAHADEFASRTKLPAPAIEEVIARLRSHIPVHATPETVGLLAPGTKLAACPKCKRPAVSAKPACQYCGAALVVPATCGKCQRKNAPTAKACMYCRAPL